MNIQDLGDELIKAYRKQESKEKKENKSKALCKECGLMITLKEKHERGGYCMTCESEVGNGKKKK